MPTPVNINKSLSMSQLLEFEVAFPGEQPLTPEQYLVGGSKAIILNVAAFFLGFDPVNSKFTDNKTFIETIFCEENNAFANEVYKRIRLLNSQVRHVTIVNTYASLILFEKFFNMEEGPEIQTQAEFERNLFKAYLVINSEITKRQSSAFSSTEELDVDFRIPMMLFSMQYPVADKEHYNIIQIWRTQAIKAIYLFQFLESTPKTQSLLQAYLEYFNCPDWIYYLKSLLPLTLPALKRKKEGHNDIEVAEGDKFDEGCAFIERFMVNDDDPLAKDDFLTLRSKPFYKVSNGKYRIIFNLFVVEKIFKGVYFLLKEVNETLPEGKRIKEPRSLYGYEFSEKWLFYKVMETIYPEKCIRFSGKELAEKNIDGAPDYYIRRGKDIVIFESKDFLIRADKKASFDFDIYEAEFQRVLYYEDLPTGKQKHKAVMQLINSIRKLLKKEFEADKDYYYREVYIYPILLTHDHQYDTPGFNELINSWFQDELIGLEEEGLYIKHVKPLTVINIDTLIDHQVGLSKNISLHEMLKLYEKHKIEKPKSKFKTVEEASSYNLSKFIPFSMFIEKHFMKHGLIKPPPILNILGEALF